ncbi:hypothetical protein XENOCAPTIV_014642, partial [Xenoophorus captivus]
GWAAETTPLLSRVILHRPPLDLPESESQPPLRNRGDAFLIFLIPDLCGPDGEKVCWFSCKDTAQYVHRSLRTEELSGALHPLFNSDGRLEAAHLLSSVTKNFSRRTMQSQSHQLCHIFTRISFIMILEDLENIAKDPERWVQMTAIQI